MSIKVEIVWNPAKRGYDIWITNKAENGSIGIAKPIILDFVEAPREGWIEPTMTLNSRDSDDFLASFATALAKLGFKSDELKNTENQISAIKYHLEDMRKLVFKGK